MENQEILESHQPDSGHTMTHETMDALGDLATWMNYAAITGLVSAGISIIADIVAKQYLQIIASILTGVISYLLYDASAKLKQFYIDDDTLAFSKYSNSIRIYFLVVGILTIVGIAFTAVSVIVMIAAGSRMF